MVEEEPNSLNYVEETVLKNNKNNEEWAIKKRERLAERKQWSKESVRLAIKRPEHFVKEYRGKELDLIGMKHRLKTRRSHHATFDSKLLFVIRIHGSQDMHPKTRKVLNHLRLSSIFDGVFLKANEATSKMLLSVEPFVTYGNPNMKSVRDLVFKKGCGEIGKQRVTLTDNTVIEKALGQHNILCLEDIVHAISLVGSHFKDVTKVLFPFKLKKPENLQFKKKSFKEGGDTGNCGDKINELIGKLN